MPVKTSTRFTFVPVNFSDDTFIIVRFEGKEEVSQLYRYHFWLVSEDPDLPLGEVVNRPVSVFYERNLEDYELHGYVARFKAGRRIDRYYVYEAEVVPRLWKLGLSFQQHIYQDLSVPEIVEQVLQRNGFESTDFEFRLNGEYPAREYCTQYKESDLDFIQRLLEYEGIFYFFVQDGREKIVMTDHMDSVPEIEGSPDIEYNARTGMVEQEDIAESVHSLVAQEEAVTGRVRIRDWNYRSEIYPDGVSEMNPDMPGEFYDFGTHVKNQDRARHLALIRNQEFESFRKKIVGESDVTGFHTGHKFSLSGHFRASVNQEYFITQMHVTGDQSVRMDLDLFEEDDAIEYQNSFTAIPLSVVFRPSRITPKPRVPGILTAHIESTSDDYSHIDDEGRYKVKLPFDLRDQQETQNSKTVRLAQPYTSKSGGYHLHLEKDTEVVLACVDGDPDRIMAIGAAPKPSKHSPVSSENHTQHEIRTTSQNTVWMEDQHSHEGIKLWSPTKQTGIQLGYRNHQPIDGASIWTEGTGYFEANSGIVIKGGGSQFDAAEEIGHMAEGFSNVGSVGASVSDAVNGMGGPSLPDGGTMTQTTNTGTDGEGGIFNDPGVTILARDGGVMIGTSGPLYAFAEEDIGLLTPKGIHAVATEGINLIADQGANLISNTGGIDIKANTDDIDIEITGSGDIYILTPDGLVKTLAMNGNIEETTSEKIVMEANNNIEMTTDQMFRLRAGNNILENTATDKYVDTGGSFNVDAGTTINLNAGTSINGTAGTQIQFSIGSSLIKITPTEVVLECAGSSIRLSALGIEMNSSSMIRTNSNGMTQVNASLVNIAAQGLTRIQGAMVLIN